MRSCAVHCSSSCGSWWWVVGCLQKSDSVSVNNCTTWSMSGVAVCLLILLKSWRASSSRKLLRSAQGSTEQPNIITTRTPYSNTISPLVIVSFLQSFCSFLKKISSFSRCRLKIFERHLVVQRFTALVHIFIACFKMLTFCLWFLILQVYTVVAHWHVVFQCS